MWFFRLDSGPIFVFLIFSSLELDTVTSVESRLRVLVLNALPFHYFSVPHMLDFRCGSLSSAMASTVFPGFSTSGKGVSDVKGC